MHKDRYFIIALTLLAVGGLTSYKIYRDDFDLFPCLNDMLSSAEDAKSRYRAEIVLRDCGATTDFATIVSLTSMPDVFDKQQIVLVLKGQPGISLKWKDSHHLTVTGDTKNAFTLVRHWRDVDITYINHKH